MKHRFQVDLFCVGFSTIFPPMPGIPFNFTQDLSSLEVFNILIEKTEF